MRRQSPHQRGATLTTYNFIVICLMVKYTRYKGRFTVPVYHYHTSAYRLVEIYNEYNDGFNITVCRGLLNRKNLINDIPKTEKI